MTVTSGKTKEPLISIAVMTSSGNNKKEMQVLKMHPLFETISI